MLLPARRDLVWHGVGTDLFNHGAWLFNEARATLLAHDVFRWLRRITPTKSTPQFSRSSRERQHDVAQRGPEGDEM
jgi:hypothetical protein